jgi:hypothetical protein
MTGRFSKVTAQNRHREGLLPQFESDRQSNYTAPYNQDIWSPCHQSC